MKTELNIKPLERKWVKPSQISKHLTCSICGEVFINPRRLNCSHTFCERCILQWFLTQKTCPECRKTFQVNKLGKDLIAEKIINDLEVFCVNDKYCKWKDKLEDLPRHVEVCEFQDKNLKDWLQGFEKVVEKPKETSSLLFYENEALQERINNEVPKASLLARLFTKDSNSRGLFTIDNVATNKNSKAKDNVIDFLEGYLFENNEEEEKERTLIDKNSKDNSNDLGTSEILQTKIVNSDEDDLLNKLEESLGRKTNIIKDLNDENIEPLINIKPQKEKEDLEKDMLKKRKLIEPFLVKKLKQMKT